VISLFRPALERSRRDQCLSGGSGPGPVKLADWWSRASTYDGEGHVFLALEDETGMVNVTLWPDAWRACEE